MHLWLEKHKRTKVADTDQWYLDLANELLPLVAGTCLHEYRIQVALACALYLEDCVADAGNWREFIHWHKESYSRYLPFYSLTEKYLPDEINREDIACLLWAVCSPKGEAFAGVANPMDAGLSEVAEMLYGRLDALFESAPISEHLAPGWMMEPELMRKKRTPLPVAFPGGKIPVDVERFLEASKGKPLLFFESYAALKFFFVHSLKWEDEEDALLPDLVEFDNFIVYGNPKGLLIGPDVAEFFADEHNPLYKAEEAEKRAYEMFCEEGLCPFDLLKYGMEHQLLPDAQFPFERGKELLHENWDFVARWFLGEFYEGE